MRHEVKYSGFTATPSDYDCVEGELAMSQNIIYEKNELRPIALPTEERSFSALRPSGVWLHETASFKHYIVLHGEGLKWCDADNSESKLTTFYEGFKATIYKLVAIGNTLALLCDDDIHYVLWNISTSSYIYLGNNIPECPISFGLRTLGTQEFVKSDFFDISTDVESVTSTLLARANKHIAEQTSAGRFIFPFLVRYAYRLYDGTTLTHHSAPVLMLPSTTEGVFSFGTSSSKAQIICKPCRLDYRAYISKEDVCRLLKWGDIVKSVDIFISSPIYSYDQNGIAQKTQSINGIYQYGTDSVSICANDGAYEYKKRSFDNISSYWKLPTRSLTDILIDIKNCSQFYFLTSIPIENLSTDHRAFISISKDYLAALNTREVMSDDYMSHDAIVAKNAHVYNGRLNVANIRRRLFDGYDLISMVCYRNEALTGKSNATTLIHADGGNATLKERSAEELTLDWDTFSYMYHPNTNAFAMNLAFTYNNQVRSKACKLSPHSFLNGALYFEKLPTADEDVTNYGLDYTDATAEPFVNDNNRLYTSEVNNPFYFPLSNIKNIGIGTILGICSASKAMSTGQFGQFPLYAFTEEGVWALRVASDGTFAPAQPFTRDVCSFPNSITQLDSSVVFATDRGLMLLSGAESICISDVIDNQTTFSLSTMLPHVAVPDIIPFREYLLNVGIVYDYVHQRLLLFNGLKEYGYVFSMESKCWGMIATGTNLLYPLPSYTGALVVDYNGIIFNFSKPQKDVDVSCMIITRPITCGDGNTLKTISEIIQRGYFKKGHVSTILYGSRNLMDWHVVSSSQDHIIRGWSGTPYKYFRVAALCFLPLNESLSGCSLEFTPKATRKMR